MDYKFRAKCINTANEGEWVTGSLVILDDPDYGGALIVCAYSKCQKTVYDVDSETICQFTGLTDNNGQEIYEGDILEDCASEQQYVVDTFDAKRGSRRLYYFCEEERVNDGTLCKGNIDILHLRVIGNIYDNHELLTKQSHVDS